MTDIPLTPSDFGKSFDVLTSTRTTFVLAPFKRHVLELDGIHFHFDSAVLLPCYSTEDGSRSSAGQDAAQGGDPGPQQGQESSTATGPPSAPAVTSLAVIARTLRYAQEHPTRKLLVTGHSDTTGDVAYNVELTRKRADNVLFVLQGPDHRDDWVKSCKAKSKVEDVQQILKWIAQSYGWTDVDPGKIDNSQGKGTTDATKAFQQHFNDAFDRSIAVNGSAGDETWGAFFDLYMEAIKAACPTDDAGLRSYIAGLSFLDPPDVGCGKSFPIEQANRDQFRSQTNRRVELIFFDTGEEPDMSCHPGTKCAPSKCQVFNTTYYGLDVVQIDDDAGAPYLFLRGTDHKPLAGGVRCFASTDTTQPPTYTGTFDPLGRISLKRLPDGTAQLEVYLDDGVKQAHPGGGVYEVDGSDGTATDAGVLADGCVELATVPADEATVVVDFGPGIWLRDIDGTAPPGGKDKKLSPLKGSVLTYAAMDPTAPLQQTLPFSDKLGRVALSSLPQGTARIEVQVDQGAASSYADPAGSSEGHYQVLGSFSTDPAGKVLATNQLRQGKLPLNYAVADETVIAVGKWNDSRLVLPFPRPFYIYGHNPNSYDEVRKALDSGANGLEPDVNVYSHDENSLCISHGEGAKDAPTLQDFLQFLAQMAQQYPQLAMIVFDCKPKVAASPALAQQVVSLVRQYLTSSTGLNVIYSGGDHAADPMLQAIGGSLQDREGIMIDGLNDPNEVTNFLKSCGAANCGFGNGISLLNSVLAPNVRPSMEEACWLRCENNEPRFIYVWTVDEEALQKEYIRIGVSGMIADYETVLGGGGFHAGNQLSTLRGIVDGGEFKTRVRMATRDDNPYKAPLGYGLIVKTGDLSGAGTNANVTLTLTGKYGTATVTVDGSRPGRFERNTVTYVTLESPGLGDLISLTVSRDSQGLYPAWFLDSVQISYQPDGIVRKTASFSQWFNDTNPKTVPVA